MQISERSYGMKGVGPFYVLERHFLRVSFCLSKQPFLKASYLETLSVGKHTLAIVSETGTAATEFTVKAAASDDIQPPQTGNDQTGDSDNSGTSTGDTVSPRTGDSSNVVLWVSLLFASGAGLLGATVYRRKKKYNQ